MRLVVLPCGGMVRRGRLRLAALIALAVAGGTAVAPGARAGERRWPLWPSEVRRAAEPLVTAPESGVVREGRRVAAIRDLDAYATPLVAPILLAALGDRSSLVRREVLHACLERQLLECVPAARKIWLGELDDAPLRVAALRVVLMGPDPDRLQLFLAALRDADALIRAESLRSFAAATWPREQVAIVRANLIAKLADPTPEVRRAAVHGLGVLGPDPPPTGKGTTTTTARSDGALPLARLLTDPDPQVRQDTAEALARLRDPRTAPAILRALQTGDETYVGRALLHALAALPGPASGAAEDRVDIDAELLRLLDAAPRNLMPRHVAEAIGRRRRPGPALAQGLVARLREDALRQADPNLLRQPALDALLGLGEAARPALVAALARGLEPPLEREVRRLLAALDPPASAVRFDRPWPEEQDRSGWQEALADPDAGARLRAAAALAARSPAWLGGAAGLHLERAGTAEGGRAWLVALAGSSTWTGADRAVLARLERSTDDAGLASGDRCLALAALARHRPDREPFERAARRLAAAPEPAMRACAAAALAWMSPRAADPLLAGLLRDPSARVRTGAALALACRDELPPALAPQLAAMAVRDTDPAVVRAVDVARAAPERCERWGLVDAAAGESGAFVALRWRGREILAPAETLGPLRFAWGPGLGEAGVVPSEHAGEPVANSRLLFD